MAQFKNITSGAKGVHGKDGKLYMVEPGQLTPDVPLAKDEPNGEWFGDPDENLDDRADSIADRISEADQAIISEQFENMRARFSEELQTANERADDAEQELAALRSENEQLKARIAEMDRDGDGKPGGSTPSEPVSLSGKNKAELLAIAKDEGVTIEDGATNDDIKAAIELKREG